jgi:hypothetical protein
MLTLAAWTSAIADPPKAEEKKAEAKLDPGEFRVNVEAIVEPPGDIAIYRIQVWTAGKEEVEVSGVDVNCAVGRETSPEPDGKLHRGDFVVVVILRPHPDPKFQGKRLELEQRLMRGGFGTGEVQVISSVNLNTKLEKVAQFAVGLHTTKIDTKLPIGKLNGSTISVRVEKPKPR